MSGVKQPDIHRSVTNTFLTDLPENLSSQSQLAGDSQPLTPAPGYGPDNRHELKMAGVTVATADPEIGRLDLFGDLR